MTCRDCSRPFIRDISRPGWGRLGSQDFKTCPMMVKRGSEPVTGCSPDIGTDCKLPRARAVQLSLQGLKLLGCWTRTFILVFGSAIHHSSFEVFPKNTSCDLLVLNEGRFQVPGCSRMFQVHSCSPVHGLQKVLITAARPHPWGLLITFIELIKNSLYQFWLLDASCASLPC